MPSPAAEPRYRLAFDLPPELGERTEAILDRLRESPDRKAHVRDLIEIVLELTEVGLRSYFVLPLEQAGVGMVTLGTAKLGIATAGKAIPVMVKRILSGMSDEQLLRVADFMDGILIREEEAPEA